ncbi:concanavalin A-like lectin/glucanase [Penicillium verhagenii]|uniref:concanavalin A-like lectin/glucanase n=1 Tax=Penicillium verhagenii TaxID=1562060 RepID=UPI0025453632|nr:concanavalin A-like lectin/glucanase [Penicillium verhagenii]KAJ5939213.1 concanavalin A-like lectin/glucanase [Penicillium verhagenii]
MMTSYLKWAAVTLAAAQLGAAQTYTSCNPTEKTCPSDKGLAKWEYSVDFTQSGSLDDWNITAKPVTQTSLGAKFEISEEGEAPTIASEWYIFFGRVDVKLRASNGTGIVSTFILESDDLDEIDWEQVSTYPTEIQTDYFGKGNTTGWDRATTVNVTDPETEFHTYSIDWTEERIEWLIDDVVVRTLEYADANDGTDFPQTPSLLKIGIWAGGDSSNSEGTIEWAGGETDFDDVPFIMYVESVKVINYNPAQYYKYSDKTGDYSSIKMLNSSSSSSSLSNSSSTSSSSSSSGSSSSSTSSSSSSSASSSSTYTSAGSVLYTSAFVTSIVALAVGAFQL